MADQQRVNLGRPGLSEWGGDLGEIDPRVFKAVRAGMKANVTPSPSGVPTFAGLLESAKSLPALPMFLGDLLTGGKYDLSSSAPEFALEASEKYDALVQKYLEEEGLGDAASLPFLQKYGLAAGEMLGQLPVPGKLLERATKALPKAFKPAGWLAEYFGPTVDPKAINYAIGTGVGGTLRTVTGEEEPEKFARGGLGRKPLVKRTPEGVVETVPPKLEGTTIVKPTGNINLAPAIRSEALRGPEKQTLESFRQQAAGLPGVTRAGFEEEVLLPSKMSPTPPQQLMTKSEFESFIPPSQYSKIDLAGTADSALAHYMTMAADDVQNNYDDVIRATMERIGLDYDDPADYALYEDFLGGLDLDSISPDVLSVFRERGIDEPKQLQGLEQDVMEEFVNRYAREMMENDQGSNNQIVGGYQYSEDQRLPLEPHLSEPGYFEIGVTHPSMEGKGYRHYSGAQEPLIGHIRGTFLGSDLPDEAFDIWQGGEVAGETFRAKPGSVVIEEIQSDVQKGDFEQKGALRQVHGTLFKAAVQDALERGANTVYLPTSIPIASVRGKSPKDFASIYDQQIVKEGLNPLKKIPGVSITPIRHEGKTTYYEIDFTPEAKEYILQGPGQLAPGYAKGGIVRMARGGLGRKKILKRTEEGVVEDRPPQLQGAQILKEPGGNWLPGSVERIVSDLQRTMRMNEPVDNWLEKKLTSYIKNDMATERDPVRKGIEQRLAKADETYARGKERIAKSQQKIADAKARGQDTSAVENRLALEIADLEQKYELDKLAVGPRVPGGENYRIGARAQRQFSNSPALASTPESAAWEDITDYVVDQGEAVYVRNRPFLPKAYAEELARIPYDAKVYELRNSSSFNDTMAHIRDELYNSTREGTDLPPELRLKPEDLQKMNMDAAVAHVGKVDAWRERNRAAADLLKSRNAATVTFKEYPGTGLEWKELKMPTEFEMPQIETRARSATQGEYRYPGQEDWFPADWDPKVGLDFEGTARRATAERLLQEALEYEGNVMGHCVGGYCPQVARGETQIFSLRDAKGEPHVTIEVQPADVATAIRELPDEWRTNLAQRVKDEHFGGVMPGRSDEDKFFKLIDQTYIEEYGEPLPTIVQIKGKGNEKPAKKYIPFVQDFVKSGTWGAIGDIRNTDMRRPIELSRNDLLSLRLSEEEFADAFAGRSTDYLTDEEILQIAKEFKSSNPKQFADGGRVETDYTKYNDRILRALIKRYGSEAKAREVMRTTDGGELLRIMFEEESRMADGGLVEEEYNEEEIEQIVAPLREKLQKFLGEAQKVPRRVKQAASKVGQIGEIIEKSKAIPLEYYDPKGEVAGEADAMRHLLFQGQLARKYGETPAKIISYVHEYTSPGQPAAEREMDFFNDELGRELGLMAGSDEELIELARKYIDSGRVKTLPEEQRGGY